jgi:Protein kinase domain
MNQRADTPPLIEERIDTGLKELLESYKPEFTLGGNQRNGFLNGKITIDTDRPLPHLNTSCATAYEAADSNNQNRQLYALILKPNINYRLNAMDALYGVLHPNLLNVVAHGTVFFTGLNRAAHTVVIEKPAGVRLSEIIQKQRIGQEHIIRESILLPLCKGLLALREKRVSHGCINTQNIFISETLQLAECVSTPSGFDQNYLYEPLERMMADSAGKGQATEQTDVFAVGVLAYELLYGLDQLKRLPKEHLIPKMLEAGIYNTFTSNIEFPDSMQDFFRGILCDDPKDRWGLDQLQQWLNGKRFNMIGSSSGQDSVRPIEFDGENFYSQRALAHRFHQKWREAVRDIRALRLDKWAQMSLHKPDVAEYIVHAIRVAGSETAASERRNNEMVTRIVTILDPIGPIRTRMMSLYPDNIGYVLSACIEQSLPNETEHVLDFIQSDLSAYWADITDNIKNAEYGQLLARIQRTKTQLNTPNLGFGLDRAIYELNPNLPCQSPLVLDYHVTSISELLKTLDGLSKKLAPETSLVDKHIAAFISSKTDIGSNIKLYELMSLPQLANNQELIMLKILTIAQSKQEKLPLVGLCTWAAMRIEHMLDAIHNRTLRRKLKLKLKSAASSGQLLKILDIILDSQIGVVEHHGYSHAIELYKISKHRIEILESPEVTEKMSIDLGGRMASLIAYLILAATCYKVLTDAVGW